MQPSCRSLASTLLNHISYERTRAELAHVSVAPTAKIVPMLMSKSSPNLYTSPTHNPSQELLNEVHDSDDDFSATKPTTIVKATGYSMIGTGLLAALSGIQLILFAAFAEQWMKWLPFLMLATGGVEMMLGQKILQTRGWALYAGIGLSLILGIGMGIWSYITLTAGVFSLLAALTPPAAIASIVLGGMAYEPCLQANAARKRLQTADINVNF